MEVIGLYVTDTSAHALEGDPASEIVRIAGEENIDAIIIGTWKSRIDKHLHGSVTEKVVHSALYYTFDNI